MLDLALSWLWFGMQVVAVWTLVSLSLFGLWLLLTSLAHMEDR